MINSLLLCILFMDMLDRRFPNEFRNYFINLSYNCLYIYSKLQIFMKKFEMYKPVTDKSYCWLLIKNKEILESRKSPPSTDDYDFFITYDINDANKYRTICYQSEQDKQNEVDPADIKFLAIDFRVGEKKYKIELKTEEFNYYLVRNKFTKDFFMFYLKYHLKITDEMDENQKFFIDIIDHNVNVIEFEITDKSNITLDKNDYKLDII